MALISCKKCGSQISEKAEVCPCCGNIPKYDNKVKSLRKSLLVGIVIAIILAAIIYCLFFVPVGPEPEFIN